MIHQYVWSMQFTKQLNLKMVCTERASLGVCAALTFITSCRSPRHADVNRMPELLADLHVHGFSRTAIALYENDMTCVTIIGDNESLIHASNCRNIAPNSTAQDFIDSPRRLVERPTKFWEHGYFFHRLDNLWAHVLFRGGIAKQVGYTAEAREPLLHIALVS